MIKYLSLIELPLQNTGEEEIEILTARNSNRYASNQVKFYLTDKDGNVLSTKGFKQSIGEFITGLSNGNTVARIPAGAIFTSDLMTMTVPANAPDEVNIVLDVSKIYFHQGRADQVAINGLSTSHEIFLIDTAYYGTVSDITPEVSTGNEDIVITGMAIERETGDPMPDVPLRLVVTVSGFERKYTVYTDETGVFTYNFHPLANEAGKYTVRAVHPDLRNKPVHGTFVISRVGVSPTKINMSLPRNYKKTVSVRVSTSAGTSLTNAHLVYDAADQPGGVFPDGVNVSLGSAKNVPSGGSARLAVTGKIGTGK